jgi:hypothetical protein
MTASPYLDPGLSTPAVLQAADGPFQLCVHGHVDLEPLPNEARPAGLFA